MKKKKKLRRKAFVIQKVFLPDFISNHSKSIFFVVLMFVGQKNIYSNIDLPHFTLSSSNPRPLCIWLILFYFYLFCFFFLYQRSFSFSTDKYLNIKVFNFLWTKFSYKIDYNLKLQLYSIPLTLLHISKIKPLDYMFFTLLIHKSNFVLIEYYLLYNLLAYILCIILNY